MEIGMWPSFKLECDSDEIFAASPVAGCAAWNNTNAFNFTPKWGLYIRPQCPFSFFTT